MHMILAITEGSAMKYFEKGKRAVLEFCTQFFCIFYIFSRYSNSFSWIEKAGYETQRGVFVSLH